MTYVITGGCCNDAACIPVCPVQAIHPRPGDPEFVTADQLYIDPNTCIDCGACLDVCPVGAISTDFDLPDLLSDYATINAEYFDDKKVTPEDPPSPVRRRLPVGSSLRVAVVGTGPSACYAIEALTDIPDVDVTILESLPTPLGLLRAGVAPDHSKTKLIGNRFLGVLKRRNVQGFFNVEVGVDVSVSELLEYHNAVLWAGGAPGDRSMGIPGEDLPGSHSAREFVGWYNGHPAYSDMKFDLSCERVVVIGNGNVALDVARILAKPVESLATTDIADHALEALRKSQVREVVVIGRRGVGQVAFTTGAIQGLSTAEGISLVASPQELSVGDRDVLSTSAQRKVDILTKAAAASTDSDRRVSFRFLSSPVSVNGTSQVESVTLVRNELVEDAGAVTVVPTSDTEILDTGLVLRAVGYRGRSVPDLPFNEVSGTIPHAAGRVFGVDRAYVTGWIKRGPTGVIGTNKPDALESVNSLIDDYTSGLLPEPAHDVDSFAKFILERKPESLVTEDWLRLDAAERSRGRQNGRPRVKYVTSAEMVSAAKATTDPLA